jgi:hypothetical protein
VGPRPGRHEASDKIACEDCFKRKRDAYNGGATTIQLRHCLHHRQRPNSWCGHFLQFDFVAFVLVGMFAGRKVCWWTAIPLPLTIVLCLGWGALIGFALHSLFREFNPGTIPKVFAYGAGAYVSVPNYGLIAEASISEGTAFQGRHLLIQVVPCLAFVGASLWLVLA